MIENHTHRVDHNLFVRFCFAIVVVGGVLVGFVLVVVVVGIVVVVIVVGTWSY